MHVWLCVTDVSDVWGPVWQEGKAVEVRSFSCDREPRCCIAGDRDNVVYGALYRLDQASFTRHDPLRIAANTKLRSGYAYGYDTSSVFLNMHTWQPTLVS